MKKFSCSTLAVMMRCIENVGLEDRLFLSAIVKGDRHEWNKSKSAMLGIADSHYSPKNDRLPICYDTVEQKKPGFLDNLCLSTDIFCKNPVSEPPSGQLNLP